jgi:hypothetical protein
LDGKKWQVNIPDILPQQVSEKRENETSVKKDFSASHEMDS